MFRAVPRSKLDAREDLKHIAPGSTKYSPSFAFIHVDPKKNYQFGDKGEGATTLALNERREKGESG
jgi:hypothetical protein